MEVAKSFFKQKTPTGEGTNNTMNMGGGNEGKKPDALASGKS
jgi:hypothetical protein